MDTRGFKLCAAAVGILPVTAGCTDRAPQEHPNILFILSDDHTSQSWGIYGGIPGAVRRQRQHRPPCRRRVRAGQRVLHQLDLGAEPGRDPHRAVQPPERRLHARRRTASRTRQHRQAAAAGRLPDGADRQMASEKGTGGIRLLQRFPRSGHLPRPGIQDGRKLDGRRQGRRRCGGKGILDRSGDRQGNPLDQRAGPDEALFYVLPLQGYARTVRLPGAVRAPLRRREVPRTGKPARIRTREVGPHVRGPAARNDGMALEQGLHRSGELVDLLPRTAFLRRRGGFGRQPPGHLPNSYATTCAAPRRSTTTSAVCSARSTKRGWRRIRS